MGGYGPCLPPPHEDLSPITKVLTPPPEYLSPNIVNNHKSTHQTFAPPICSPQGGVLPHIGGKEGWGVSSGERYAMPLANFYFNLDSPTPEYLSPNIVNKCEFPHLTISPPHIWTPHHRGGESFLMWGGIFRRKICNAIVLFLLIWINSLYGFHDLLTLKREVKKKWNRSWPPP